jgi:hypothetical protein
MQNVPYHKIVNVCNNCHKTRFGYGHGSSMPIYPWTTNGQLTMYEKNFLLLAGNYKLLPLVHGPGQIDNLCILWFRLGQGFKHKKIHHILCLFLEWWNNKLAIVLSTMDVEYMTMSQATKETMWLHNFLHELGFTQ